MSIPTTTAVPRGTFGLAAHLYLPADFDEGARYAAVVVSTPGSSVKEQIGANYARRLADRGLVALAFDPAFQGQSGGEPRDLEVPAERVADLRHAVDFLQTQEFVDGDRIGVLGVCAGAGYAVSAATTDHRIKAVGTVVPVDIGRAFREFAATGPGGVVGMLDGVGRLATDEMRGDATVRHPWIPDTLDEAEAAGVTDVDVVAAVTFYRTPRGYDRHSTNRRHYRSDALILGFDAFHLVDELLTQPLQVVVAGEAGSTGSFEDGLRLARLAPAAEEVFVVDGARHYQMYDEPSYVDQAVGRLHAFFVEHLAAEKAELPA